MFLNILLETATTEATTDTPDKTGSSWWIYLILIVLVVLMLVLPSITNRRRMKEYNQMVERLRVGDEVRTIGGVIGRVTKINTKGDIQTFILETGSKGSKTTMEFDMASVGTVLKSNYVPTAEELEKENKNKKKNDTVKEQNELEENKKPADEANADNSNEVAESKNETETKADGEDNSDASKQAKKPSQNKKKSK